MIADFTLDKKMLEKGNNKEMANYTQKEKKDLFLDLLYQSLLSQKNNILEKGNNKEVSNITGKSTKGDTLQSKFIYDNVLLNKNQLNQHNNIYEVYKYSNKLPEYYNNINYDNTKNTKEIQLHSYDNEKNSQHRKPNNQSNDTLNPEIFENDTEFKSSGEKDRKTGNIGHKYMFNNKEYETDMNDDDNINDLGNLIMKRH